jgi:hypothetical protein
MIKLDRNNPTHGPFNTDRAIHGATYENHEGGHTTIVQIDHGAEVDGSIRPAGSWVNLEGGERWAHDMVSVCGVDRNGNAVTVRFPLHMIPIVELSEDTAERLLLQIRRARVGTVLDRYSED